MYNSSLKSNASENSYEVEIHEECEHKYFYNTPNCIHDIGLTAYEIALYGAIKRTGGGRANGCYKSYRTLAEEAGMCKSQVGNVIKSLEKPRPQLNNKPLIKVARKPKGQGISITIVDIWKENILTYSNQGPKIVEFEGGQKAKKCPYGGQSVHMVDSDCPYGGHKKTTYKNNKEEEYIVPNVVHNSALQSDISNESAIVHYVAQEKFEKPQKKLKEGSPIGEDIATFFYEKIKEKVHPTFRKPNLKKWAIEIDKLLKTKSKEEIEAVISWVVEHSFWKTAVLSAEKLNIQFDVLQAQIFAQKDLDIASEIVKKNMELFHSSRKQHPQIFKNIKFDKIGITDSSSGRDARWDLNHSTFATILAKMTGATIRG